MIQKWVPKVTQPTTEVVTILAQANTEQIAIIKPKEEEMPKSTDSSVVNTLIHPIVHQWKMVTRKNRGKRIIVPCDESNDEFLLEEK